MRNRNSNHMIPIADQKGFTMLEVLISVLISAVIVTGLFQFYSRVQTQADGQYTLSEAQHRCRSSLQEIKKTLRMAGYKIGAHPDYEINGDTLSVYMSLTQPVDTIQYYLVEFNDTEYATVSDRPNGVRLYNLVKKVNSDAATIYSDYITGIRYTTPDPLSVQVSIGLLTMHSDLNYQDKNGFRSFSLSERVRIRNAS